MEKFEQPKNIINIEGKDLQCDSEGFVRFGDVALYLLNEQTQYASYYISGKIRGYANLGDGLRFSGRYTDYHTVKIHKDDIEEFIRRWRERSKE
jgi:hypothetical protein